MSKKHTTLNCFDNHDKRIPYYELLLERDLDSIPKFFLPKGFHFEFYKNGDRDNWIEIEKSAKEFESFEQGIDSWNKYYSNKEDELRNYRSSEVWGAKYRKPGAYS